MKKMISRLARVESLDTPSQIYRLISNQAEHDHAEHDKDTEKH
jgi:hypothetical protein